MKRPPMVILAGGKGTRLQSVTGNSIPKPMVDVFGKPFLHWIISHYVLQGFTDITISTGHLSDVIEQYRWPWAIKFERDSKEGGHLSFYTRWFCFSLIENKWVVNGDTFIPETLPVQKRLLWGNYIVSCKDVDAGAQLVAPQGKTFIHPVKEFYDIGTPEGLERFKEYFKNHPLYLNSVKNTPLHSYCGAI